MIKTINNQKNKLFLGILTALLLCFMAAPAFAAAPSISSMTPSYGRADYCEVTIRGSNFGAVRGTSEVTFGTTKVATYTAWSNSTTPNVIKCMVPTTLTPGVYPVNVTVGGQVSNSVTFEVTLSASSISPTSGVVGDTVTISGIGFGAIPAGSRNIAANHVAFFAPSTPNIQQWVPEGDFTSWTDTQIVCQVPAGVSNGYMSVTVTSASRMSQTLTFVVLTAVPPTIESVSPASGPVGADPWTTYVNITGENFGVSQGSSVVSFGSTAAGTAELWTDSRVVVAVPSSLVAGSSVPVSMTVYGMTSNSDKTFIPIAGKMIDNYEDPSMYSPYYNSGKAAGEVTVTTMETKSQSYDGQYSMQVMYPGATGSQWGGYWGGGLQTKTNLDLTSCNMLVFKVKGDGSNNTIRLGVTEFKDGINDEPYIALDQYSLSDSSGFKEYKIPFSRLVRNEYAGAVTDDNVFSKKIKNYTFDYYGTNANTAYNYIDFVTAVNWTGPIMDQMGPNSGAPGTTITIEGSGFGNTQGTSTVTFNGVPVTPTSWSSTEIVMVVPPGATSGLVDVTVSGQTSNDVPFTVTSEAGPAITLLNPTSGRSGTQVTISGSNFGYDPGAGNRETVSNHVMFGTTKITDSNVISWSPTQIVVNVPALGNGVYPVQVRAGDKESNMADFTIGSDVTAPGNVSNLVVANPATGSQLNLSWTNPSATDLAGILILRKQGGIPTGTPVSGTVYSVGSALGDGTIVYTSLGTSFADSGLTKNQLYGYKVYAYDNYHNYASGVTGTGTPAAAPTVTAVLPASGSSPNTGITITGTNFTGVTSLEIGTTPITIYTVSSETSITGVSIPSGLAKAAYDIRVTNSVGQSPINAPADRYTVTSAGVPTVTGISPASGLSPNTGITITGTNFTNVTAVVIGTTPITTYTVTSATSITAASIPSGLSAGAYDIQVTNSIGQSPINAPADQYTVIVPTSPIITSVTPEAGPSGDSPWTTYVNINGSNFGSYQGSSAVNFGSTVAGTAEYEYWSDSRIVIAVPSSVGVGSAVPVTVTANGLLSNNDKTFTPIQGKMIDNYEDTSMYNYYNSGTGAGEVYIPAPTREGTHYYEGMSSVKVIYPGANTSLGQWGGYWGGSLKNLTSLDLSSCNMLVFRMRGDGTNNTIRLDVLESGDAAKAEPYGSLDQYSLSDGSDFTEYKIPFSRLWRNEYLGSVKDDDVFSKSIQSYTFNYFGTNTPQSPGYNCVDFVTAVNWTGPMIDQLGPNSGPAGTSVTISGSGFGPSQGTITFNGVSVTPTTWSDTQIVAPAGTVSGPVIVTVGGQASNGVPFTVSSAAVPTITKISPEASGKSGDSVKIIGSNFGNDPYDPNNPNANRSTASNHVVFGTNKVLAANVTSWSSTEIDVIVPNDASGQALSDGIYPVQVTAGDKESNLVNFTVGTVITGPVTNILITREGDTAGSNIGLSWTCSTGNVDIYTKTGTFGTDPSLWTKGFSSVSGTQQVDNNQVGNGINKWYKIVPAGATLTTADLTQEVLGKFDIHGEPGTYTLFSLPLRPFGSFNINSIIGGQVNGENLPSNADEILIYNGVAYDTCWYRSTGEWYQGLAVTSAEMRPDYGYWLYVNSAHTAINISLVGKIENSPRSINITGSGGYTLVGSNYAKRVELDNSGLYASGATEAALPGNSSKVLSYNGVGYDEAWLRSVDHKWYTAFALTTIGLEPGKGYWIYEPNSSYTWNYLLP